MDWLSDKVALVTGGGSGIGRAVVARFIDEGAKVVVLDRSADRINEIKKTFGNKVTGMAGDVSKLDDNRKAVALAVSTFGKLNILIANAGIFDGGKTILTLSESEIAKAFDEVYSVNVKGALFGIKAAVPELIKTKGSIVFTLSHAAFYAGGGGPIYCSSKSAMVGMMREVAYELAPDVRLNGVAPGGVLTDLQSATVMEGINRISYEEKASRPRRPSNNALGISTMPDDLAGSYVFLASDQSSTMTGVTVHSDGGSGIRGNRPAATPAAAAGRAQ